MSDDLTALEERFNLRLAVELADVRTEIADLRGELRTEISDLRGDVRTGFADLRGDVEAKLKAQTWKMVTTLVGVSGLAFALARFT